MKRPSFQFYPGDWLNDAALRMVSVPARGLWIEMICLMHQGSDYGYLKVNHKVILPANLARMCGATLPEVEGWLEELEGAGVFYRDESGCIYSKRMIRDEEIRKARADGGKLGGNPNLKPKEKDNLPPNLDPTPSSSSSSSTSSKSSKKKPKTKPDTSLAPATRLPVDWKLPKRYGEWAKQYDQGWSNDYIRDLGEAFKDYWTALPDNRFAKKVDWFATWRVFLRQRARPSVQPNGQQRRGRHWYSTEEGIKDKAADIGYTIPAGLSMPQVVEKIIAKMEELDKAGESAPPPAEQPKTAIPLEPEQSKISPEEAQAARAAALEILRAGQRERRGTNAAQDGEKAA